MESIWFSLSRFSRAVRSTSISANWAGTSTDWYEFAGAVQHEGQLGRAVAHLDAPVLELEIAVAVHLHAVLAGSRNRKREGALQVCDGTDRRSRRAARRPHHDARLRNRRIVLIDHQTRKSQIGGGQRKSDGQDEPGPPKQCIPLPTER